MHWDGIKLLQYLLYNAYRTCKRQNSQSTTSFQVGKPCTWTTSYQILRQIRGWYLAVELERDQCFFFYIIVYNPTEKSWALSCKVIYYPVSMFSFLATIFSLQKHIVSLMASKGKDDDKGAETTTEAAKQQHDKPSSRPQSAKADLPPGAISGPFDSSAALLAQYGYTLGPSLGKGSYAVVKSAQSRQHKRKVAIKIISKKKAPEDYLTKFLPREIQVLKRLRHPHCITLLEAIETNTRIYMIMNLAENGDLLEYIRTNGALSDEGARSFFTQLISATEYFHSIGIVHRDLKCENLLLDHNYNIVVSDFGFARASMINQETKKRILSQTFCGSYAYAPPEILRGIAYDGMLADVWSLGVVLFTMVSASLPFDDSHLKTLLEQVMRPVHFSRRKNISPEVKDLIRKMLQPDVQKRYDLPDIKEHIWMKGEKLPREEETKNTLPVLEAKEAEKSTAPNTTTA